jgi:chromosome segregation protein
MVKLEKIEMNGFKSFVSTTEFTFGSGITAVVGPNGCGKSNIADAINWVIGERSSKTLRADHMGDVIFSGTENRRPQGMAEVTLLLGGVVLPESASEAVTDEPPPGPDGTGGGEGAVDKARTPDPAFEAIEGDGRVSITRRIFRSGESEYLIDGQKKRLKDIQELLAHTGVGTGVYSIIEQGKIDRVISARPRDRRVLIEEAAGIALYKIRKRQAQSKLESTEANLARINDIVSEQERQIGSLKRQAARARRYARISEGIDRAERVLFHHEHLRLESLGGELAGKRSSARETERAAAEALSAAEERLHAAREEAARESQRHQEARDALHELDRLIDGLKRGVERSREQESASEEQIERADKESAEISAKIEDAGGRERGLMLRLGEAREAREELDRQAGAEEASLRLEGAALQADEAALAAGREDMVAAASVLSDSRNEINRLDERREALLAEAGRLARDSEGITAESAELEQKRTAHGASLAEAGMRFEHARREAEEAAGMLRGADSRRERIVVEREQKRGLLEGIGERLAALREVDEMAPAAAAADGAAAAPPRLVKDLLSPPEHLDRALDAALGHLLRGFVAGTSDEAVSVLRGLKDAGRGRAVVIPDLAAPGEEIEGMGEAADPRSLAGMMGDGGGPIAALRPLLRRIVVAEDLDAALRLRGSIGGRDIVTLQGDFLAADGWMEGGAELPEEAGTMTLKRLLERLDAEAGQTRRQIEGFGEELARVEERLSGLRAAEAEWRRRAEELGRARDALLHRGESLGEEEQRLRLKRDAQAGESERSAEDLALVEAGLREADSTMRSARQRQEELQRAVESLTGITGNLRISLRARQEALAALREQAASARVAQTTIEAELRHHAEALADLGRRLDSRQKDREEWEARRRGARERIESDGVVLSDRMADRLLAEGAVASAAAAVEEQRQGLETLEGGVSSARGAFEAARESLHAIALEEERHAGDLRNLESRVAERGWSSLAVATAELSDEEKSREREAVEAELVEWKEKRERIGPVNLMAMEQYTELEERYTFITAQRKDLEDSIRSLRETILRINRQSKERFLTAFESIRGNFSELYKVLFRGGRADLRLAQDGDGEDDILEAGLEISAQPPGKRLQSISLLSGGEKALTALALLFAIFRHSPSPFCLLDEVDAALDELNVSRYVTLLKEMSGETQFIVITHSRRTMEEANMLYGITMEEPGVSRAVSVVMGSPEQRREAARSLPETLAARHRGRPVPPAAPRPPQVRGEA